MQPDPIALAEIIGNSRDDEDLAEEFGWYCGDYVDLDSHEEFFRTTMALPEPMRRLYLALNADGVIAGDGFSGYIHPSDPAQLYTETAEGFRMIGHHELASILLEAVAFLQRASPEVRDSKVEVDRLTGNIHGRYFCIHSDVAERVGAQVRALGDTLLK